MPMSRRALIAQAAMLAVFGGRARAQPLPYDALIQDYFAKNDLMGLEAAVVAQGKPVWTGACGTADAARRMPMTPDTVVNIASLSKTVTAAAVMRLAERGLIRIDDDATAHLPFAVRNPLYDAEPITIRHLLAHVSSVADGPAYAQSYVCGPAQESLGAWLEAYFAARARGNFHPWPPGEKFAYSNVGYGLLGAVVETVSGSPFAQFCEAEIFRPLGMARTSAGAARVPPEQQAVDYTLTAKADAAGRIMPERGSLPAAAKGQVYIANCAYSFPTAPDGLVRTSAADFARFLASMAGGGAYEGHHLLHPASLDEMFREQFAKAQRPAGWPVAQGLAWCAMRAPDGGFVWMHNGADPGVNTLAVLHRPTKSAVALFANSAPAAGLGELAGTCLQLATGARK